MDMQGYFITSVNGVRFDIHNPKPEMVLLDDIAHSLSMQCRFIGHINHHYSVAEHSVFVSHRCPPDLAIYGLLHDAPEAYCGDISAPLKNLLHQFSDALALIEHRIECAVARKFGLDASKFQLVKYWDRQAYFTEERDLRGNNYASPALPPASDAIASPVGAERAKQLFVSRFWELMDHGLVMEKPADGCARSLEPV